MGRGRLDRHLPALPAARRHVHFLQRQRHQACGHVLAGRYDSVIFTRIIHRRGLVYPADQLVRLSRHGRNDDDHVIALGHFDAHAFGRAADTVQGGHRRATKLHHQNRHMSPVAKLRRGVRASAALSKPAGRWDCTDIQHGARPCSASPKRWSVWPGTAAASAGYPLRSGRQLRPDGLRHRSTGQVHRQDAWRGLL